MTVEAATNKAGPYNVTGTSGTFARPFLIRNAAHLRVVRVRAGVETDLTVGISHTGIGQANGSVTVTAGLLAGDRLYLLRNTPNLQRSDYISQGRVRTDAVEADLDLAAMGRQDLAERLSRTLSLRMSSSVTGEEAVEAALNAAQYLAEAGIATDRANAAAAAAELATGALGRPYVIFAFGQSNMRGFVDSIGGDKASDAGVFFWDAQNGAPVTSGSQFRVAAFGTPPLDNFNATAGEFANNLAFHAAKRVRQITGRAVYVVMISRGSMPIECFISDDVLAANGWSRGGNQDLYTQSVNALGSALPLIPGAPTQVDAIIGHHGEANMADPPEVYARKMKAALLGIEAAGFASRERTVVALGEVAGGGLGNNATRHRAGLYRLKESWNFDKWRGMKIVSSSGLPPASTGNVHFTGGALVSFGHRYAEALFTLQNDREITLNDTDFSVDGSLAWATTLAYSSVTDYFGRLPGALDFPLINAEDNPTLGWAYVAPAGQNTVLGHRQVLRIPHGGVIRIDYEVLGLSETPVTHQPFCWTWTRDKVFQTSSLGSPASNPTAASSGRRLVSFTFKRAGSPAVADLTLPAGAEYFSPGIYLGGGASGAGAFNILDMRVA